jgi:hypothetical protein
MKMARIELANQRGIALVDDADARRIRARTWRITRDGSARTRRLKSDPETWPKNFTMHRFVLDLVDREHNSIIVSHINGDRHDNRKENLRARIHSNNHQREIPGVSWYPMSKKWGARITINRKSCWLGLFDAQQGAINAREKWIEDRGLRRFYCAD